jgi:hypothetical protein
MANYKYFGLPLTPAIMEELILQLFDGRLQERQTIVEEVLAYHQAHGGVNAKAMDVTRSLKRALSNLKTKGLAENPTHGFWKIGSLQSEIDSDFEGVEIVEDIPIGTPDPTADIVLGDGRSAVYLYYLPLYKVKAENDNQLFWPCKIGRTDRDPLQRVLSQAATALPEKPHIALIVKTDMASYLETAIHAILSLRKRRIDSAPGAEWYLTSPDEVLRIVGFLLPEMSIVSGQSD